MHALFYRSAELQLTGCSGRNVIADLMHSFYSLINLGQSRHQLADVAHVDAQACQQQGQAAKAVAIVQQIEQAYSMKMLTDDIEQQYFAIYNQQQYEVQQKFRLFSQA